MAPGTSPVVLNVLSTLGERNAAGGEKRGE
jgi:hypothetical protein